MLLRAVMSRTTALLASAVAVVLGLVVLAVPGTAATKVVLGQPEQLRTDVAMGRPAITVSWEQPALGGSSVDDYTVYVDGAAVATVPAATRSVELSDLLVLGRTYWIEVQARSGLVISQRAGREQTLYVQAVTTPQQANPTNPLAGSQWGVYRGMAELAYNQWVGYDQAAQDRYALFAMMPKAKWFGGWIPDAQVYTKTREYIENSQDGDPERLSILSLFRMYPWEGESDIKKRLPTPAEIASYKSYVSSMAAAIGDEKVAVIVQPDGYFAKAAYDAHVKRLGRKKALVPSRLLAWTARTLAAGSRTTLYMDMGSEDWARGDVASTAKFLKLVGVRYARGFSLNVTHLNYQEREIRFGKAVVRALAKKGIKNKHFVLDTSENGNPIHGAEANPRGAKTYTAPHDIDPCRSSSQLRLASEPAPRRQARTLCTSLGIPPTTDVDNPAWGLTEKDARTAGRLIDAYLWIDRPWLPKQGSGGTKFSTDFADGLLATWRFSPYYAPTS